MIDYEKEYSVSNYTLGETKSGAKMGKLMLKDVESNQIINCVMWEETVNRLDNKLFRNGNIVKIISGSCNEKYNNCIISDLELIKEGKLGLTKEEALQRYEYIKNCAECLKREDLREYIKYLMEEHKELMLISPAAKVFHHNYLGGLLQHIYECIEYANCIFEKMVYQLDRDYLIAACILHDFGKIFEYKIDSQTGLISYDEKFQQDWLTHSQWGYSNCMTNGFTKIAKMIAAHHSRPEWGAIIDLGEKNLDPYLYLMHHIDDLSAKFGKISIDLL